MNFSDKLGRPLRDLRLSVTDRCNFRCMYCMPKEIFGKDYQFLPRDELLTFEEIFRLAQIFVNHGITKIRLTGGEPLLRRDIEKLVFMLSRIPEIELAMTTNGSLLAQKAIALKEAGLQRITVSIDSLDNEIFKEINDVDFSVDRILMGIEAAEDAGFSPLKINTVIKRGVNESSLLPIARFFSKRCHIVRFIEYMDVGSTNDWRLDEVVPAKEIIASINAEMPISPIPPNYQGEVAKRWRYKDGSGEIGIIASVTQPFCEDCTRARLSVKGQLFTCLFATAGYDLRKSLRQGKSDGEISNIIQAIWNSRQDSYSENRNTQEQTHPKVEMSYIGG